MNIHPSIRRASAAFLLLLFAFSITPRKILHDWVANHKDRIEQVSRENSVQAKAKGFNCNCESLVVVSPYTTVNTRIDFTSPLIFAVKQQRPYSDIYTASLFFFALRGPPAVVRSSMC